MTSVQGLREFITERLSAAAVEIFTVVERTVVQYEEEIGRQRRLLDGILNPQIKLHRIELKRHHDFREERLFEQETNNCLEQEEPERQPPKIGEQPETQKIEIGAQTETLKIEIGAQTETPKIGEEPELLQVKEEHEEAESPQTEVHKELGTSQEGERHVLSAEEQSYLSEREEVSDTEQILSRDFEVHNVKRHIDPESTINAELKETNIFHSSRVDNVSVSENQAECEKLLSEETCGGNVRKKRKFYHNLGALIDNKRIICKICGKRYNKKGFFLAHMRTHRGENRAECEKLPCEETSGQNVSENRKLGILNDEEKMSCDVCGKSYRRKAFLMSHMRVHKGEKPAECEKPPRVETRGKNSPKKQEAKQNKTKKSCQKVKTLAKRKSTSCEFCGRTYSRSDTLLIHMRNHTGEKPYCCEVCGKNFRRKDALVAHMRSHTGERPFSCDTCGKNFRVRCHLLLHKKIHTGERPHSCEICPKRFSVHSHLVAHMRTHTGERPFSCQICGKCFRVQHNVLVHMRTHTGERPFPCETCGRCFTVHSHLLDHMRTHTGERPYVCELCAKTFSIHSNLLRHMKTHRDQASFL